MRTTLNIDDDLLGQAGEYTGEKEKTALVRMGLEALIEREAARRLAALGGKNAASKSARATANQSSPGQMILVDTSVWVQHFRRGMPVFADALARGQISIHQVVLGELACGNLSQRTRTLTDLRRLPHANSATFEECLSLIETRSLYGRGLGWVDASPLLNLFEELLGHRDCEAVHAQRVPA